MRIPSNDVYVSPRDKAICECLRIAAEGLVELEGKAHTPEGERATDRVREFPPEEADALVNACGAIVIEKIMLMFFDLLSPDLRKKSEEADRERSGL